MKYRPKLDPQVELAGAIPETLVRALLRNRNPRPRSTGKPVVSDLVPVEEAPFQPTGQRCHASGRWFLPLGCSAGRQTHERSGQDASV